MSRKYRERLFPKIFWQEAAAAVALVFLCFLFFFVFPVIFEAWTTPDQRPLP